MSRPSGTARLATGNRGGVYRIYGAALARLVGEATGALLQVVETDGSAQNVSMLGRPGGADLAFSLADTAADAFEGRAAFSGRNVRLSALAKMYENYVHVCVLSGSRFRSLRDLQGQPVGIGSPRSGTAVVARRILAAAGVSVREVHLDITASARALAGHEIAALIWGGGLPTHPLAELQRGPGFRLIDIEGPAGALARDRPGIYNLTTVPASVYGTSSAVATLSVSNYILAREGLPDSWAWWVVSTLFDQADELSLDHPEAASLDVRLAIDTAPIPLHSAAARWYRRRHDRP